MVHLTFGSSRALAKPLLVLPGLSLEFVFVEVAIEIVSLELPWVLGSALCVRRFEHSRTCELRLRDLS